MPEQHSKIPAIRDHEQEPLREAAMWVVLNWDAQRSQHGSMPALRRALGLPGEPPTQEEAEARILTYIGADDVPPETVRELARCVLAIADAASMPDTYWQTDSRIRRARRILDIPDDGRITHAHLWETDGGPR